MTKVAQIGKMVRGRVDFVAATVGTLPLDQMGPWSGRPDDGGYSVDVTILRRQVVRFNVATAADNTDYRVTVLINGVPNSFVINSGVGATTTTIKDALVAKIVAAAAAGVRLLAASVSATDFTVTALDGGNDLGPTVGANMTIVSTTFEANPDYMVCRSDAAVIIRTAAAYSGSFDVVVQG